MQLSQSLDLIRNAVRSVPDFPKKGILFRDFTPILKDVQLFTFLLDWFEDRLSKAGVDYIVGIESRGFILGAALAARMKVGFVPARKTGKLPGLVERHEYDLEYGSDCVEMHADAFPPHSKVAIIDDLLATGGTAAATAALVKKLHGDLVSILFMIELDDLRGRDTLPQDVSVAALIHY